MSQNTSQSTRDADQEAGALSQGPIEGERVYALVIELSDELWLESAMGDLEGTS